MCSPLFYIEFVDTSLPRGETERSVESRCGNSRLPGCELDVSDVQSSENVKRFLHEFASKSLAPHSCVYDDIFDPAVVAGWS